MSRVLTINQCEISGTKGTIYFEAIAVSLFLKQRFYGFDFTR